MLIDMPEGLRFMELTMEKALEMWHKMNDINGLFDDFLKDNFAAFRFNVESQNSLWLETTDGNGLVYLLNVTKGLSATAHFIFWDRRLRGKEELCRSALKFAITNIPLVKVNVFLPDFAPKLARFIVRLGFQHEGKIRRWSLSNGRLFDVNVFGITSEEVMLDGTIRGIHESTDATDARAGVHGTGAKLFQQPEHSPVGPTEPGGSSNNAVDQPDAAVDRAVRSPDREVPVRSDGGSGSGEHRRPDEPVPAEANR